MDILQGKLGYTFTNEENLAQALTHPSVSANPNFQRLEFLGDSILNFCISTYLFNNFPNLNEGELTLFRSYIVKKTSLLKVANNLELQKYIKCNITNQAEISKSILADSLEALIGAIYIDSENIDRCYEIVINLFADIFAEVSELTQKYDYKSYLQQKCQKKGLPIPIYNLIKSSTLKNKSLFEVAVEIDGKIVGYGIGRTVKEAEQNAAKNALDNAIQ
jgi:ribonuclease-3